MGPTSLFDGMQVPGGALWRRDGICRQDGADRLLSVPQSSVYKHAMSPWTNLLGIVGAFGMLALIALAPSAANAHAGHKHATPVETRGATVADVGNADIAKPAFANPVFSKPASTKPAFAKPENAGPAQELRSAGVAGSHAPNEVDCGDRGCCGNGHCAGCCTALAPSALSIVVAPASWLHSANNADLPPGLGTSGPPRPPRSFV